MKKLIVLVCVLIATVAAQASYLYWQVGLNDFREITGFSGTAANYATVYAVRDGEHLAIDSADLRISTEKPAMGIRAADLSDLGDNLAAYSFYIELANYTTTEWGDRAVLAVSSPMQSYSYLLDKGYIQHELVSFPDAWTGAPFNVPEPTSGMMILLGLAGLALRRKVIA